MNQSTSSEKDKIMRHFHQALISGFFGWTLIENEEQVKNVSKLLDDACLGRIDEMPKEYPCLIRLGEHLEAGIVYAEFFYYDTAQSLVDAYKLAHPPTDFF